MCEIRGTVSMPREAFDAPPHINWRHIDGPLMSWAGRLHWLTWAERIMLWIGVTTPEMIAFQRFHRPIITKDPAHEQH